MKGYFRSTDTNPNWLSGWGERIQDGDDYEEVLDYIARLACGIEEVSSDTVQKYAKHIRTHIQAAFIVGKAEGLDELKKQVKELKERRDNYFKADMAQQYKIKVLEKKVREMQEALQYVGKIFDDGWKDEDDEYWRTYLN